MGKEAAAMLALKIFYIIVCFVGALPMTINLSNQGYEFFQCVFFFVCVIPALLLPVGCLAFRWPLPVILTAVRCATILLFLLLACAS